MLWVRASCGTLPRRVTLELGGKSPTILLDDAGLNKAIPAALILAFMNSGQACAAGTRLLVPKSRLEEVKRAIQKAMSAFTVGDPADPKTAVGPMVSKKQYDRVESYIRKGSEEGAEVLVGGEGHPKGLEAGYFVKPTVFVNVKNNMAIAQEEIFWPCAERYLVRLRRRSDPDRQRLEIWSSRRRHRHGHFARTPRGLPAAGGPCGHQRHDRRSTSAMGRIQVFRLRPRIRQIWNRGISRNPSHS